MITKTHQASAFGGPRHNQGVNLMAMLSGKKGLIIGIANEHSLAYGCAQRFRAAGADLAITYLNVNAEYYLCASAGGRR